MDLKQQFTIEVFQLARRWRIRIDERLKVVGLTKSSWAVLYWISRSPHGVGHRQLAEQVGIETSTLTRQLDAMQAQGLIERAVNGDDRRSKQVRLTPKAVPLMERMTVIVAEAREELLSDIDPVELGRALDVLRRVRARLSDEHEAHAGAEVEDVAESGLRALQAGG